MSAISRMLGVAGVGAGLLGLEVAAVHLAKMNHERQPLASNIATNLRSAEGGAVRLWEKRLEKPEPTLLDAIREAGKSAY